MWTHEGQGWPSPSPFGLMKAQTGSLIPFLSVPNPVPGVQPIPLNIWFPIFDEGIGLASAPTVAEENIIFNINTQKRNNREDNL